MAYAVLNAVFVLPTHASPARTAARPRSLLPLALALVACGGPVHGLDDAGSDAPARTRDGALVDAASPLADANADAGPRDAQPLPYRDVPPVLEPEPDAGCPPDSGGVEREVGCDYLDSARTCGAGQGCVEEISWAGDPVCGGLRFRYFCDTAGTIAVGERCNYAGGERCVPGAFCLAAGSDNRCYQACVIGPGAAATCPRGTLCEPTDSPDWGACL